jgi:hypothetical protein
MDQFNQFNQTSQSGDLQPLSAPSTLPPPLPPSAPEPLALPPLAIYPTREALFEAIQSWSKLRGYAFTVTRSKKLLSGRQKVYYACDRCPPPPLPREDRIRDTQTRGTSCPFTVVALQTPLGEWELKYRPEAQYNTHNHLPSKSPTAHHSHRRLSTQAINTAQSFFSAGIQPRQTLTFLRQADPTTLIQPRDLYNQNTAFRHNIQQGKSSTEALIQHL